MDFPEADEDGFGDVGIPVARTRVGKVKQLTGDDDAQAFHNAQKAQARLPWYLLPTYGEDVIKLEYDGSVRAGTLLALIERLTVDPLSAFSQKSRPLSFSLSEPFLQSYLRKTSFGVHS